jgi:tRNA (mo5U34)-methyltransferase
LGARIEALEELRQEIDALGPWFHNLHLPEGLETAPEHPYGDFPAFKWRELADTLPRDLTGWTALDIGCNAGFYSFELARRGARVTGIDREDLYLDQAHWAVRRFGLTERVRFERRQIHDLARERRRFDLVLFMGVFYHLRYPTLAVDTIARLRPRLIAFQSLSIPEAFPAEPEGPREDLDFSTLDRTRDARWPRLAFIEGHFDGDETNWWLPNSAAVIGLWRSAGFRLVSRPSAETYLFEPGDGSRCGEEEWRAATGIGTDDGRA